MRVYSFVSPADFGRLTTTAKQATLRLPRLTSRTAETLAEEIFIRCLFAYALETVTMGGGAVVL